MGSVTNIVDYKLKKLNERIEKKQIVCDCNQRCIMAPCDDAVESPNYVSYICKCGQQIKIFQDTLI